MGGILSSCYNQKKRKKKLPSPQGFRTERPPRDKNTSKSLQQLNESLDSAKYINIKINDQMLSFFINMQIIHREKSRNLF